MLIGVLKYPSKHRFFLWRVIPSFLNILLESTFVYIKELQCLLGTKPIYFIIL